MGAMRCSSATPTCSTWLRSVPNTFTPMGVRTPVVSMSTRVLIGMVQALVHPGNCIFPFISVVSSSQVMGCSSGQTGPTTARSQPGAQREYHRSWCFLLGMSLPAMEQVTQRGGEGDGQQRGEEHHEGLVEGKGAKDPPRLAVEGEDRQERHRDDQQREEDRRGPLPGGLRQQPGSI